MRSTLGHIQINIDPKNLLFYKELLEFLGWSVLYQDEETLGMKGDNEANLWFVDKLKDVKNDYDGIGMNHLAIAVSKQAEVDQAAEYLKSHGIATLFDTPRHRPEFREDPLETYYQVMFESPDRILLEVVYSELKDA
jgi:catechol 2,3-dioxygenase-like lactoylglutathione lyase family enzyme